MTRSEQLRDSLERSRERLRYAEREFQRFMTSKGDVRYARTRRKLLDDLSLARNDIAVLARALTET